MNLHQRTVIDVITMCFGEDKINCQNCNKPIRDHDAQCAHECLELTSLEILSQNQNQITEVVTNEVSVPAL